MDVINRLKNRYLFVLKEVWSIWSNPNNTLKREELLSAMGDKSIMKQLIFPMAEMLMLLSFVTNIFNSGEWQIANAVVKAMFNGIVFVTSYGLLYILLRFTNRLLFGIELEKQEMKITIAVFITVTFAVKILQLIFPSWFFIFFLYVYILYLSWLISDEIVKIREDRRNRYMVITSIIVIAVPIILMKIMMMMVPNLAN